MAEEHRDCSDIDEMLPAYAVNALDDTDRARVESHLLSCERHEDAAAWGDVALRLSDIAPEVAPPDGLRERVLAIPHGQPDVAPSGAPVEIVEPLPAPPAPVEQPSAPVVDETGGGLPLPFRPSRAPWMLAAAFAALAVFFGAWTAVLLTGGDGDDDPETPVLAATSSTDGIEARATFIEEEGLALVRFSGLSTLPEGSDYQLWAIGPGAEPAPAGIAEVQDGEVLAPILGEFEVGWTFAITIEPEGGSPAPTSDPIVTVTF